jgi:hypothetical protein
MPDIPPPPPPNQYVLLHDARIIHDTASLRFKDFESNGIPFWVLAKIIPAPGSGSATVPGAYINADTGRLVAPPGVEAVIVKKGRWAVTASARSTWPSAENEYSWSESLRDKRLLLPEDYYSPFVYGGTILCRPTRGATGIDQFGPVRLLLPEWARFVVSASVFAEGHPALFEGGELKPRDDAELKQLLLQENKLLAVLAFRTLLQTGHMTSSLFREQLTSEGNVLAMFTYLVLSSADVQTENPLVAEIYSSAKLSPDLGKIRSLALGAFAAALFHSADTAVVSHSKSLLNIVQQRLAALSVTSEKEPYIYLILEKMDIR